MKQYQADGIRNDIALFYPRRRKRDKGLCDSRGTGEIFTSVLTVWVQWLFFDF